MVGLGKGEAEELAMPDNPKVIAKTSKETGRDKKEVKEMIERFQDRLNGVYPIIKKKADKNKRKKGTFREEGRSFIYPIYDTEDHLVVGGAANIILYVAKKADMSKSDLEVIRTSNRICAEKNRCTKHALMDDVVHIRKPETEEMDTEEMETDDI